MFSIGVLPADFTRKELSSKIFIRKNNENIIIILYVEKTKETFEIIGEIPVFYQNKENDFEKKYNNIDDVYNYIFSFVDMDEKNQKYIYIK